MAHGISSASTTERRRQSGWGDSARAGAERLGGQGAYFGMLPTTNRTTSPISRHARQPAPITSRIRRCIAPTVPGGPAPRSGPASRSWRISVGVGLGRNPGVLEARFGSSGVRSEQCARPRHPRQRGLAGLALVLEQRGRVGGPTDESVAAKNAVSYTHLRAHETVLDLV